MKILKNVLMLLGIFFVITTLIFAVQQTADITTFDIGENRVGWGMKCGREYEELEFLYFCNFFVDKILIIYYLFYNLVFLYFFIY